MKYFLSPICIFLYLIFSVDLFAYSITQKIGDNEFCKIAHIDDGDTFDLDCTTKYYSNVRLLGVNTPDKNSKSRKESCYYSEAKDYIEKRIHRSYKAEFYGSDLCKDPYKGCRNLVRLIDIEGDFDLGERMIMKGIGFSWTNFSMIPSSIRDSYDSQEALAYEKKLGLWGKCQVQFYDDARLDSSRPDKMTTEISK